MAGTKRSLHARTQARNERGQFAATHVGPPPPPPRFLILVDSDSDSEVPPAATEKRSAAAAAAGKEKEVERAPARTEKSGSATFKRTTKGATPTSKKKGPPYGGPTSASMKKGSASYKKAIDGGASASKQKKKVWKSPFLLPPSMKCDASFDRCAIFVLAS